MAPAVHRDECLGECRGPLFAPLGRDPAGAAARGPGQLVMLDIWLAYAQNFQCVPYVESSV